MAAPTTSAAADASYGFSFRISYTVTLTNIDSVMDRVVLYLPIPSEWDSQKSVQIESITPEPFAINTDPDYGNKMAYFLLPNGVHRNQSREFTVQYTFTFHQTHVIVDRAKVSSYNTSDPNYVKYAKQRPSDWVESDDPTIKKTASEIVGSESNPYRKAKLIYDWIVTNIEYKFPSPWGAKQTYLKRGGDCGSQTALFCAMAISQGIPCRAVSGLIFWPPFPRTYGSKGSPSEPANYGSHVYAEFYLPNYGWVPADTSIGSGSGRPEDYFGDTWDFFSIRSKGFGIQMTPPIPERVWLFPHYTWWFWGESRKCDSYYTYRVENLKATEKTSSMLFMIDGSASDWVGIEPIITKGATHPQTPGRDIKSVYGVTDGRYLYVMIRVWSQPDPGNNYIFALDLTGSGKWNYSFGFNGESVWMYDLRGVPNGQWPNNRLMIIPDATYAVGDVAEIAIPLGIIRNPTRINVASAWIYYPSLETTVDQTGNGATVVSATSLISTTASVVSTSTPVIVQTTMTTVSNSILAHGSWVWILGLVLVLIVATTITVFVRFQRKQAVPNSTHS